MITELQIQNFKCFKLSPTFQFSKLNLLTGINGRGKSSLLQSIILISQSSQRFKKHDKLILNGRYIQLGNYDDVKNSETPRGESISYRMTFINPKLNVKLDFIENEADPLTAKIDGLQIDLDAEEQTITEQFALQIAEYKKDFGPNEKFIDDRISHLIFCELITRIHYISADRLGPVKYVDKTSLPDFPTVGPRGEYTLNILSDDNLPLVHDNLYKGKEAKTVIQQAEEWLSYVLEGAKIQILGKERGSNVLQMLLNNKVNSYGYKPFNVGFGYSYVLPIIVTGLIAKPGEIIIIENPEAHLHPRAQSKITEFLARVASIGVQVFIESHSEHILNGLRVSSLNPDIKVNHDELTIQYFDENFEPAKLTMDNSGKIENWPHGFFDQQEIDLASIFKHSR